MSNCNHFWKKFYSRTFKRIVWVCIFCTANRDAINNYEPTGHSARYKHALREVREHLDFLNELDIGPAGRLAIGRAYATINKALNKDAALGGEEGIPR